MESELKFAYQDGYSQFDIMDAPIISDNLLPIGNMSYAMRSSYYDTSDNLLWSHQAVLRMRRSNDRYYLTLKLPLHRPLNEDRGFFERQEYEFELTGDDCKWDKKQGISSAWFLSRLRERAGQADQDLRQLLQLLEGRPLQEVCLADFTRTTYAYEYRTSRFELCFDDGYLGVAEHVEQFSEIEFELLSGHKDDLLALYISLIKQLPIVPQKLSKYGRAIAIANRYR